MIHSEKISFNFSHFPKLFCGSKGGTLTMLNKIDSFFLKKKKPMKGNKKVTINEYYEAKFTPSLIIKAVFSSKKFSSKKNRNFFG